MDNVYLQLLKSKYPSQLKPSISDSTIPNPSIESNNQLPIPVAPDSILSPTASFSTVPTPASIPHVMANLNTTPPSLTAVAISVALISVTVGYFIGQGSSIGLFGASGNPTARSGGGSAKKSWPNSYDVKVHADSSDEEGGGAAADDEEEEEEEDDEGTGEELKGFSDSNEEVKLVLCVRTDLGMTKGKIAAQASHATLACYKYLVQHPPSAALLKRWEYGGQAKVALQTKSEEELLTLQAQAISLGLCARKIQDAGRTQIAAGSTTVLGILGPKSVVDQVTGSLKLL